MTKIQVNDDDIIRQDNERGPGWFLKIAYVVISLFCVYYFFTYRSWKSNYEEQQDQIQTQLRK